jgi:hypothetical protein
MSLLCFLLVTAPFSAAPPGGPKPSKIPGHDPVPTPQHKSVDPSVESVLNIASTLSGESLSEFMNGLLQVRHNREPSVKLKAPEVQALVKRSAFHTPFDAVKPKPRVPEEETAPPVRAKMKERDERWIREKVSVILREGRGQLLEEFLNKWNQRSPE